VGDVNIFGIRPVQHADLDEPETLKSLSISPSDVINAIQQQNLQVPAGQVGMPPGPATQNFQYTVNVAGRLDEVEQFENIIVKMETGQGAGSSG